ncbi:MAG: HAMP domain-containing sensor histidine kinase [bacterium]|nr:HAMP domain-containing sensor histidine kinase [bacterium]
MNKTAFKIFLCFTCTAAVTATILMIINFMGFAFIGSDTHVSVGGSSPSTVLEHISGALIQTDSGFELSDGDIIPPGCWCILIDENGDVAWSQNKPEDIPHHYSINDTARMTRWFLNDYPVYVRTEDYGLLVLGMPKKSVGKYDMVYSMNWFDTLPRRLICVFAFNLCLASIFAFIIGLVLYKRLYTFMNGISDLRSEKKVSLKERGIFRELAKNINKTSEAILRKNAALASRDRARSNWISGISHDIRTPLSVIMGYSEELAQCRELTVRTKAEAITSQSIKIKKLIEDLNLISSLEYDMQPSKKSRIRLCPLIRRVVTDIINSGLSDKFEIKLDLRDEAAAVSADEHLLERAVFNLIGNSIRHNKNGCKISISEYSDSGAVYLNISDNGIGVPNTVLENISEIPKTSHGIGLPMAYKIIRVHGGRFKAENNNGFAVKIELPKVLRDCT